MMRNLTLALLLLVLPTGCDSPECGNGKVEDGEDCDGDSFAPIFVTSCRELGFNGSGRRDCTSGCRLDETPCTITGRCGDGVVTPGWEDCDVGNLNGQTCESLGYYGGLLTCGSDCRFGISACRRCGDGILQEDQGELFETGNQTCDANGFFGGFHQTEDCVTPHFETCGDYRLVSQDPGVSRPVIGMDAEGRLWLSGLVRGAFVGFPPLAGCPLILPHMVGHADNCNTWDELNGYYMDPQCDQEFLAAIDGIGPTRILAQQHQSGEILRVIALPDGGAGLVRLTSGYRGYTLLLELVDEAGGHVSTTPIWDTVSRPVWTVQAMPNDALAFSFLEGGTMASVLVDPSWSAPQQGPVVSGFQFGGVDYTISPYAGILLADWESPTDVAYLVELLREDLSWRAWCLIHLQHDGISWKTTQLFPLETISLQAVPHVLHLDPVAETVEIAWAEDTTVASGRWSFAGAPLSDWHHELPSLHSVEGIHPRAGGGFVVAGAATLNEPVPGVEPVCASVGSAIFGLRLDADGVKAGERYFLAPGLASSYPSVYVCDLSWRSWAFDGNTLVFGGTHLRDTAFCSAGEPIPTHAGMSLYACDIHLIRLTL